MKRREFLIVAGAVAAAGLLKLNVSSDVFAAAAGEQFKGTNDGFLYKSLDKGQTWQLVTHFGSIYPIRAITPERNGQLTIRLNYAGHDFQVYSQDRSVWYTS